MHSSKRRKLEEDETPPGNDSTPKMKQEEETGDTTPKASKNTSNSESDPKESSGGGNESDLEESSQIHHLPALHGCRSVDNFKRLHRIEEGTYGIVYKAQDKQTGEIVALKKLKLAREKEGFPLTSLREVRLLMTYKHENVVEVKEIVVGTKLDQIFIVMEYLDHDLKTLMQQMQSDTRFLTSEVKCLMIQLLSGVKHLHDNWIVHRDLKTSNLLYTRGILKIADFGLARPYGSPLKSYTQLVVTLWYRAPELLLGAKTYTPAIDMWSVGCIFAELITKEPLLPGRTEIDQLNKIFTLLGSPNEKIWPGMKELPHAKRINFVQQPYNNLKSQFVGLMTQDAVDLLNRMLTYDPSKRITATEALQHPYFTNSPRAKDPDFMPTWPSLEKKKDEDQLRERLLMDEKNTYERFMMTSNRSYGFRLKF